MKELSAIQIPHGLADPLGGFAYVSGPQGLIYRLDLVSGETQASTNFPGSPLAIFDDMLIAWAHDPDIPNTVRLLAFSLQKDILSPIWEQTIELPTWVEVSSPEPERFGLKVEIRGDELVVNWEAHSRYVGGPPPPPGIEASETRDASGVVHIDPNTGTILQDEQKSLALVTEQALPDLPTNWKIVPYLQGESWVTKSWLVNSEEAFLARTAGEPGIFLIRRIPGSAAIPVEIRLTEDPAAVASVNPDGKFVFIHEPGSDTPSWLVYSVETNELISSLPFDPGTQGLSLVGDQVLYLVTQERGPSLNRSLNSRDLQTGQLMWSFPLEEEATVTPPPPPP